jgi:hypothetical protein
MEQKTNLTFGQAIEALRIGKRASREGWNGKGMFLFIRPAFKTNLIEMLGFNSIPKNVKDYYELKHQPSSIENNPEITFSGYICMKAADDSIVNGWLASQTDMLAEDWCVLD